MSEIISDIFRLADVLGFFRRTILLSPQNQIFSSPSEFSLAPRSDQDSRADRDYRRLGGFDEVVNLPTQFG